MSANAHVLFVITWTDRFPHTCTGVVRPKTQHCRALCRAPLNSHRDLKIPTREEIPSFHSKRPALQRHPNNKPLPNSESSQTILDWSIRELVFPDRLLCLGVETSECQCWLMATGHMWKNGLYHGIKHMWKPTKELIHKRGQKDEGNRESRISVTFNTDIKKVM